MSDEAANNKPATAPSFRLDAEGIDRAHSVLSSTLNKAQQGQAQVTLPRFVRLVALVEIALFLAIALAIDWLFFNGNRFIHVAPHPFWVIVLLVSVQYGTNAGLIAALASAAALLAWNLPAQSVMQDYYDYLYALALQPALWLAAALVLGELSGRERDKSARLATTNTEMAEQLRVIDDAYRRVLRAKEGLEARLAGQLRTVVNLYQAARRLEQLGPSEVIAGIGDMVRAILSPRKFSAWLLTDGKLQVVLTEGWREDDAFTRQFDANQMLFQSIIAERRYLAVANREDESVLGGEGVLAGPLIAPTTGEVIGMVKIEDIGFLDLNNAALDNLRVMCEWISAALAKAIKVEKIAEGSLYNVDTTLFSTGFLERQTEFLLHLAERTNFDVCQLSVRVEGAQSVPPERQPAISAAIGKAVEDILRDTDMAFDHQRSGWEFAVLLPATTPEGAELVGQKLRKDVEERLKAEQLSLKTIVTNHVLYRARRAIGDGGAL